MATEALVSEGTMLPQALLSPVTSPLARSGLRQRIGLGNIFIDNVDEEAALKRIRGFVQSGQPHQIVTVNLDFLSIASRDEAFRSTINAADLAVADGMPLVWLSRLGGQPLAERVAGVELVTECCRMAAEMNRSVFLLGAAEGVADTAATRLQAMYPGLRIAGTYSPAVGSLTRKENERIVRMIRRAAPDFLFVALGAPRQDLWIEKYQPRLRVPVAMGVGCVFDLLAGERSRAPQWMQRTGLEWAYRLVQEPNRLWRRYLLNDLPMLARLAMSGPFGEAPDALAAAS